MDLTLRNLAVYCTQIALIVATATVAMQILQLSLARARLAYWHAVVATCLAMPLLSARTIEVATTSSAIVSANVLRASTPDGAASIQAWSLALGLLPWLLLCGAFVRMAWLGLGLLRLRQFRSQSVEAVVDADIDVLRHAVAPRASFRWSDQVAQPVTFGLRRPVVLLPRQFATLPLDAQRGVVCHELLHVARRDWLWMLLEECVRALFWFHPAMWWALGQVQVSREQTVDALVVRITATRRSYMAALLAFADAGTPDPAIPFARRRHLMQRIRQLSEEKTMSHLRLGFTATALVGVMIGSTWEVAAALPFRKTRTAASNGQGNAVVASSIVGVQEPPPPPPPPPPGARRPGPPPPPPPPRSTTSEDHRPITRVEPTYPPEALGYDVGAVVTVKITVAASGEVIQADTITWRLTIGKDIDDPNYWANKPSRAFTSAAEAAARQWTFEPGGKEWTADLEFVFRTKDSAGRITNGLPRSTSISTATSTPSPGEPTGTPVRPPIRVGGNIVPPRKIHDVKPEYPADALAAGVQGAVILELLIGGDGAVRTATVMRSIPMLDDAAVAAASQWRFQPTLLNGAPIDVVMIVTVNFTRN